MGTHISRVKSVDLDSWTDEQLQSVLKWGNARANKYWEAKLAPGHVPSEAKIENFIRTKYESKRWVMDGVMPDPSTLDAEGDDDIPLNLVKEKQNLERSSSQSKATPASRNQPTPTAQLRRVQQTDLFGDDTGVPQPSTTTQARVLPKSDTAPPKSTKPADSLLGLDFFGTPASPPERPASTAAVAGAGTQSRPDLKQSILSLYASAPRPQPQQIQHSSQGSFGGMQSPPIQQQNSFGSLNDAFSGLSFTSPKSTPAPSQSAKSSPFAGLGDLPTQRSSASQQKPHASTFGGGHFFDPKSATKASPAPPQTTTSLSSSSDFGAFGSVPVSSPAAQISSAAGFGDLFDFTTQPSTVATPKQTVASPLLQNNSVFNLSASNSLSQAQTQAPSASTTGWGNADAWGSNDAWSSSTAISAPTSSTKPTPAQTTTNDFGWGSSSSLGSQSIVAGGNGGFSVASTTTAKPVVAADDEFGGWNSAAPVTPGVGAVTTPSGRPATGFAASEDLFSNVWE